IAHALNNPAHHSQRMNDAGRQLSTSSPSPRLPLSRSSPIRRCKTKHVRAANWLRPHPRAHDVANYAADAGIRAAVRFERRRMIARLDLERDIHILVEPHHTGVILEHTHAPIIAAQSLPNFLSRREDGFLEHVPELPLAILIAIRNPARECLVTAM